MPAYPSPAPHNAPMPADICLLDDEFDIFEIKRPGDRATMTGQNPLLCIVGDWDEYN